MVYVLDKSGKTLMPTNRFGWVRRCLKLGKAKVVNHQPFTVQLTYEPETKVIQETTLGMDLGYKNVGVSVVTEKKELFSGNYKVRTDIHKRLTDRKMYRVTRRGNKTRYRKPRFLNRKRKYSDAPSIRHKVESHTRILNHISKFLPIANIIIEVGSFDAAKINNPNINGVEYQQGAQLGFANMKEYVKSRDKHTCYFKTEKCVKRLEIHHIIFRSNGGSDTPKNLITLCKSCHEKLHKGKLKLPTNLRHKQLSDATFMNTVSRRLEELLPDAEITFGYETKQKRYALRLEKSHVNDAFVIANGTKQERISTSEYLFKRRNNRALGKQRNGFAPSSRKQRYLIQPKDLIKYEGIIYGTTGTHCKGKRIIIPIDGKKKSVAVKKIKIIFHQKSILAFTG